jgi:hypothetical protein
MIISIDFCTIILKYCKKFHIKTNFEIYVLSDQIFTSTIIIF